MRRMIILAVAILISGYAIGKNSQHVDGITKRIARYIQPRHISSGGSFELAQQVSNRCATPYFFCFLPGYAPIGTPCWCATPNGPVAGTVR